MRKCRGIAEVAAVEMAHVGVRTRARALAMAGLATANKRRKIVGAGVSKNSRSSSVQLRSRCRRIATPLTSADQLFSGSRSDHIIASCCSSNASSRIMESEDEVVQIETHSIERRENSTSSEMEAESGELESTATVLPEANSRSKATVQKSGELESIVTLSDANSGKEATAKKSTGSVTSVPSEAELEEFFGAEFIELEKRFREKYNFDFDNGVPLEGGRYEWVRVGSEEEN